MYAGRQGLFGNEQHNIGDWRSETGDRKNLGNILQVWKLNRINKVSNQKTRQPGLEPGRDPETSSGWQPNAVRSALCAAFINHQSALCNLKSFFSGFRSQSPMLFVVHSRTTPVCQRTFKHFWYRRNHHKNNMITFGMVLELNAWGKFCLEPT